MAPGFDSLPEEVDEFEVTLVVTGDPCAAVYHPPTRSERKELRDSKLVAELFVDGVNLGSSKVLGSLTSVALKARHHTFRGYRETDDDGKVISMRRMREARTAADPHTYGETTAAEKDVGIILVRVKVTHEKVSVVRGATIDEPHHKRRRRPWSSSSRERSVPAHIDDGLDDKDETGDTDHPKSGNDDESTPATPPSPPTAASLDKLAQVPDRSPRQPIRESSVSTTKDSHRTAAAAWHTSTTENGGGGGG